MKRMKTIKVKLDDYRDWATRIRCCGKDKWFNSKEMLPGNMWECGDCEKLLLVVSQDGIPYYVGDPVFDRKRV